MDRSPQGAKTDLPPNHRNRQNAPFQTRNSASAVTPVGLSPPFVTAEAEHSHPDCRWILILIVVGQIGYSPYG